MAAQKLTREQRNAQTKARNAARKIALANGVKRRDVVRLRFDN